MKEYTFNKGDHITNFEEEYKVLSQHTLSSGFALNCVELHQKEDEDGNVIDGEYEEGRECILTRTDLLRCLHEMTGKNYDMLYYEEG